MAKANLGTKRVCPETGRKFYDLEKDPIVSPYTGKEYALSFFEGEATIDAPKPEDKEVVPENKEAEAETEDDTEIETDDAPEIISLEDAEDDTDDDDDDEEIPDIPDIPDVDIDEEDDASDDDTFLEDDDDDDDLSDVIVGVEDGDEET